MDMPSEMVLEIGVTRLFGNCDIGLPGLMFGWSEPEEAHAWNDGVEVVANVVAPSIRKPTRFTFEGEPFLAGGNPHQTVTLYINGFRLGYWQLTEARTYRLSVIIEPEQLFHRQGNSIARCVWHLPESARPVNLGVGSDSRALGFCFRSLSLNSLDYAL